MSKGVQDYAIFLKCTQNQQLFSSYAVIRRCQQQLLLRSFYCANISLCFNVNDSTDLTIVKLFAGIPVFGTFCSSAVKIIVSNNYIEHQFLDMQSDIIIAPKALLSLYTRVNIRNCFADFGNTCCISSSKLEILTMIYELLAFLQDIVVLCLFLILC